jgi:hypothetical protein
MISTFTWPSLAARGHPSDNDTVRAARTRVVFVWGRRMLRTEVDVSRGGLFRLIVVVRLQVNPRGDRSRAQLLKSITSDRSRLPTRGRRPARQATMMWASTIAPTGPASSMTPEPRRRPITNMLTMRNIYRRRDNRDGLGSSAIHLQSVFDIYC